MSQGVEFRLNTTAKAARWMGGSALSSTLKIDPSAVRRAIERAMAPGLAALRRNVGEAKVKTGRLRRAPAAVTRKYGGAKRLVIVGLVGYASGVAPHATHLEVGTPPRAGRGQVRPRRYAWLAYFQNREQMKNLAQAGIENLMASAVSQVQ